MKLLHQGNHHLRLSFRRKLEFPIHLQSALELVWLTKGSTTAICGGNTYALSPGDLFLAFPNQPHGFRDYPPVEGYVMIVPMTPYLEAFRTVLEEKRPLCPVLPQGSWEHTGAETILNMAIRDLPQASDKMVQGYLYVLLEKLLPLFSMEDCPLGSTDAAQDLLLYVNHHYQESISRQDIAHATGYNESYISHIFSDVLRTTLTDYITALRIQDAKALLRDTHTTVSQIALSLGFGSIRTFNRIFLKETAMTPTQYRTKTKDNFPLLKNNG